jgi:hypothetical protein
MSHFSRISWSLCNSRVKTMPKNRGNSQLKRIYYRKQFTGNTNSLMIVTHRVNFPWFSTLFHAGSNIIEYSMKKLYYVLRVPYSLEIRRLFQTWPGVYLIPANYSSPEFMKQWVLYIIFDRLAHFLLQLQTNTGFHTSTVETRRLFETSFFIRENTVLAVLLKFSHCDILFCS